MTELQKLWASLGAIADGHVRGGSRYFPTGRAKRALQAIYAHICRRPPLPEEVEELITELKRMVERAREAAGRLKL